MKRPNDNSLEERGKIVRTVQTQVVSSTVVITESQRDVLDRIVPMCLQLEKTKAVMGTFDIYFRNQEAVDSALHFTNYQPALWALEHNADLLEYFILRSTDRGRSRMVGILYKFLRNSAKSIENGTRVEPKVHAAFKVLATIKSHAKDIKGAVELIIAKIQLSNSDAAKILLKNWNEVIAKNSPSGQ